ncbi:DUF3085 domain-containing protein [Vibrio owensii]|uniref:DUF3085 domain-containing protein n=1 Tax=Vibrio owensii TaxID=696485 RepID=UPI0040686C81
MFIRFNLKEVKNLLDELDGASQFVPNGNQLYDGRYYENDVVVDKNGNDQSSDDFTFPDQSRMKKGAIGPSLWLVKDQGLYLMTNARRPKTDQNKSANVVYAKGTDPNNDEDWYEEARILFGSDDGCEIIDPNWVKTARARNMNEFIMDITPEYIRPLFK